MATLVLLNGPPASGKSTIAARLVGGRPLALNLDIDVIRSLLGDWKARPPEAGVAARSAQPESAAHRDAFEAVTEAGDTSVDRSVASHEEKDGRSSRARA